MFYYLKFVDIFLEPNIFIHIIQKILSAQIIGNFFVFKNIFTLSNFQKN